MVVLRACGKTELNLLQCQQNHYTHNKEDWVESPVTVYVRQHETRKETNVSGTRAFIEYRWCSLGPKRLTNTKLIKPSVLLLIRRLL